MKDDSKDAAFRLVLRRIHHQQKHGDSIQAAAQSVMGGAVWTFARKVGYRVRVGFGQGFANCGPVLGKHDRHRQGRSERRHHRILQRWGAALYCYHFFISWSSINFLRQDQELKNQS